MQIQSGPTVPLKEARILYFLIEIKLSYITNLLKTRLEVSFHQIIRGTGTTTQSGVTDVSGTCLQYTLTDFWIDTVGFRYLS
jgi:hypothetical protein